MDQKVLIIAIVVVALIVSIAISLLIVKRVSAKQKRAISQLPGVVPNQTEVYLETKPGHFGFEWRVLYRVLD